MAWICFKKQIGGGSKIRKGNICKIYRERGEDEEMVGCDREW